MIDSLAVAVGQAAFGIGEVDDNLEIIDGLAHEAASVAADLLVIPELAVTGYTVAADSLAWAEPIDGRVVRRLGGIASMHQVTLIGSVLEQVGDTVFNTAVVLDSTGQLTATHRKTHLFGAEKRIFAAGDELFTLARVGDFDVGVLVCYEVEFPEMVRGLALAGAHLVAVPTATKTYGPGSPFARQVIGARATENNLYVAYANHCGPALDGDYMGGSLVAGPRAEILAEAGTGPELCVAALDRSMRYDAAAITPYLDDRRTDIYPR